MVNIYYKTFVVLASKDYGGILNTFTSKGKINIVKNGLYT